MIILRKISSDQLSVFFIRFVTRIPIFLSLVLTDDFVVVLYGGNAVVTEVISLSGYATGASGYFVLGVHSTLNVGKVNYPLAAGQSHKLVRHFGNSKNNNLRCLFSSTFIFLHYL